VSQKNRNVADIHQYLYQLRLIDKKSIPGNHLSVPVCATLKGKAGFRESCMILGLHHVAIGVDDFDRALKFYTEGLGFELVQQSRFDDEELANRAIGLDAIEAKMAMLKANNAFLELWQYSHPAPKDLRSRPCDYGYPHIALQVEDIQAEYDRLKDHGMEFVGEVVHFGEEAAAIYGRDPSGNIIELYEIKAGETSHSSLPPVSSGA
jgi:glyoxylase I family protein